jgi:plastocyanin
MRWIVIVAMLLMAGSLVAADKKDDDKKTVHIKDLKYDPKEIKIKAGETVTWVNDDDKDHTIESDDKSFDSSPDLSHGEKYQFTFKKKGKYAYHCKYHPREKGVIIVE